jgi:hypothetical protein
MLLDDVSIRRNIRQGPQPASLFEIPRDYRVMALPTDVFAVPDAMQGATEQMRDMQNSNNDAGKTQEQKLQDAMQMLKNMGGGGALDSRRK